MIWAIALVSLGFFLIMAEIFFVPGTTIVGIMGLILTCVGIYLTYSEFGTITGNIVLASSFAAIVIFVFIGFKSGAWKRFSSKDIISGRVNVLEENKLKIGDQGKAISAIRPIGKGMFNEEYFEVRSLGSFIDSGTLIEIIKIEGNHIFVKPLQESTTHKS